MLRWGSNAVPVSLGAYKASGMHPSGLWARPCPIRSKRHGRTPSCRQPSRHPDIAKGDGAAGLGVNPERAGEGRPAVFRVHVADVPSTGIAREVDQVDDAFAIHGDLRLKASVGNPQDVDPGRLFDCCSRLCSHGDRVRPQEQSCERVARVIANMLPILLRARALRLEQSRSSRPAR